MKDIDIFLDEDYCLPDSVAELDEITPLLYDLFFKETDKHLKKKWQALHNKAAERINKAVGWGRITLISSNTKQVIQAEEAPAPAPKTTPAAPKVAEPKPDAPAGLGKVAQILELHKAGKTKKEIIAMGFNKSTVHRQISEYDKANK